MLADGKTTHAIRSQKCTVERIDQSPNHDKCMSNRRKTQDPSTTRLYPANLGSGGAWVRGKRGYGLAVGKGKKPILVFLLRLFWGKYPVGMACHPKEVKMS